MGIVPLDFLYIVPRLPAPGGKVTATSLCVQGGGPVPNTLVGLSRLGIKTTAIVVVGDDAVGRRSLDALRSEGVDCAHAIIKKAPSATAIGFVEEGTGRRTMAFYREIGIHPRDLQLSRFPIPEVVHVDGRDLEANIKLARWAHRVGAAVSFDIGSIRNDVTPLLAHVDHMVVADSWALPYTGKRSLQAAALALSRLSPGTIVITAGTRGSIAWHQGEFARQPAYRVRVVDTTGAGDAFHTGYLFGLMQQKPLTERLQLGALTAALKCTVTGARAGMPTWRQLQRFIRSGPSRYA